MRACGAPARLGDEDSKLYAACADMRSAGARLLARAQEASTVRVDVSITDLISVAIGVAWAAEQTITTRQEHREVVTRPLSNAMFGFAAQSPTVKNKIGMSKSGLYALITIFDPSHRH